LLEPGVTGKQPACRKHSHSLTLPLTLTLAHSHAQSFSMASASFFRSPSLNRNQGPGHAPSPSSSNPLAPAGSKSMAQPSRFAASATMNGGGIGGESNSIGEAEPTGKNRTVLFV
jgi:hypothetical protein